MKNRVFKLKGCSDFNNYKTMFGLTAFTLSEVLITLVIIGVVAAITLPILNSSTENKEYNVARQKARATIGEALRLATINGEISTSYANAKDFVSEVLAKKYLKISKQCDSATECGFSSNIKQPDGVAITMPTKWSESTYAAITKDMPTSSAAWGTMQNFEEKYPAYDNSTFFQTLDGFSVNFFYNPFCVSNKKEKYRHFYSEYGENAYAQQSMDVVCFNAVYDMNGAKDPNTVGKDIGFISSFYNSYDSTVVAVLPHKDEVKVLDLPRTGDNYWKAAFDYCANLDNDNWILPDEDELSSIYLNGILTRGEIPVDLWFWSRTPLEGTSSVFKGVDFINTGRGLRNCDLNTVDYSHNSARCVRKTSLK